MLSQKFNASRYLHAPQRRDSFGTKRSLVRIQSPRFFAQRVKNRAGEQWNRGAGQLEQFCLLAEVAATAVCSPAVSCSPDQLLSSTPQWLSCSRTSTSTRKRWTSPTACALTRSDSRRDTDSGRSVKPGSRLDCGESRRRQRPLHQSRPEELLYDRARFRSGVRPTA